MDVRSQIFNVHVVVPIKHVVSVIVPFFQVVPDPLVVLLLNVKWMYVVVARDCVLQGVSILKLEQIHVHGMLKHGGTTSILSDKLDKFFKNALQILVCLVPNQTVCVEIDEKLHPFTF